MGKYKEPLKLGTILGGIALVVSVMLAFVNHITEEPIRKVNAQIIQAALNEAMPSEANLEFYPMDDEGCDKTNSYGVEIGDIYVAIDPGENIVGYLAVVKPYGYGGAVETIVGMDSSGTITGVIVTNMSETPGLGAKVKDKNGFVKQFFGKTSSENGFAVKKDGGELDAISSATVTSRAVTKGVNAAVEVINKNSAFGKIDEGNIINGIYTTKAETPPEPEGEEGEEGENQAEGEEVVSE